MNQVSIRNSPPSRTSRSPSADPVPHPNRRKNRQITIIDGDFQTQKEAGARTPQSTSSPSPRTSPAVEGLSSSNVNGSVPTHGAHYGQVHIHQRSLTIPIRTSVDRSSAISDTKSSGTSDTETSSTTHNHVDFLSPPLHSPIGYRSSGSSTSSLVDANMASLVQKPTSEQSILCELKRQMTKSFRHHRVLEREAGLVPKLRMDIEALQKEREQLMNELLDQRAVVMQLKQRVSLLHGQNLQLATLAQSESHGGGGGSTQVLAIRNTLVATLAQLKQMEDQVQSIPGLKNRLRDLELENERLKEKEQQLALQIPSDLPEGVSVSDYKTLTEDNARLKAANQEMVEEMDIVKKHLKAVSSSCDGLQKRMELFHSSQVGTRPLQERIKRLEAEKDSLCQEIIHLKLHDRALTDIDTAHLRKEVMSLQKANSSLQSKLEQRKIESRQQKEQLLLKLFEIEALNIKTSKYELEKQALGVEQVHLLQSEPDHLNSTPLSPDLGCSDVLDEDGIMDISPEAKVQLLRFRQLEVHIQESQTLLKTFMSDKAELENKVADLGAQLEEKGVADLQNSLHEASDKLQLARERIEMLEEELKCNLASNPDQGALAAENSSLKTKIAELQKEVQRLSEVEMGSMKKEEQLFQLENTQRACEKLKSEKQKVEKKAKERRHRLHSVASDLAKSAQLVKNYQEQCSSLQRELEMAHQEVESVRSELSSTKAQLEVKEVELRSTLKQQGAMTSSPLTALQEKYDLLSQELSAVQTKLTDQTHKLSREEQQLEEVKKELATAISKEKELKEENHQLHSRISQAEENLKQAVKEKQDVSESVKVLQAEVERARDLEENLAKLQQEKLTVQEEAKVLTAQLTSLQETISTLTSEKASLQQKVDILRDEAPLIAQESADLRVAKDEAERRIQTLLAEQEACSAKTKALEEKLHAAEALAEDVKNKVLLLQSDLEVAESELDQVREERNQDGEEMGRMKQELQSLKEQLVRENKGASEVRERLGTATERVKKLEKQRDEQFRQMDEQKKSHRSQEAELKKTQTETIPKLQAELAETVSQMNQLTADYSSRVAHIRELDSQLQLSDDKKKQLSAKLTTTERELGQKEQTIASLRKELSRKEAEFQQLTSAHTAALASSQTFSAEVKELKEKVQRSQAENAQGEISTLRTTLQHRELQLHKTQDQLAIQMKEQESLRKKMEELTNQCVGLTATKENLLRRLNRMEVMEMEYERLKQETAGGNTALLEMLEGVKVSQYMCIYILVPTLSSVLYASIIIITHTQTQVL